MQFAQIFCLFFTANTIIYCFKITLFCFEYPIKIPSKNLPFFYHSKPMQILAFFDRRTNQNDTFISCSRLKLLCCVFNVQFFVHFVSSSSSSPQIPSIIYCTKSGSKCTNDAFIRY
eukprot:438437_1